MTVCMHHDVRLDWSVLSLAGCTHSRPRPEVLSLDKLEEIFPAAHHQLANRGFAIIDEVFGHQRADALSAEVRALKQVSTRPQ